LLHAPSVRATTTACHSRRPCIACTRTCRTPPPRRRRPYTTTACAAHAPRCHLLYCLHAVFNTSKSLTLPVLHLRRHFAHANCSRVCPSRFSHRSRATFWPSPVEMGREKRKGKEVVVEKPVRKRTRAERGREGRDGGQGRRGAGIRPCSSVHDQGAASQGQGQRSRYG
jgi:hypothetical protein